MTSNNVIVPIKLCLNVGNDEWISIRSSFDGRIFVSFAKSPPPPSKEAKKAPSEQA